MWAGYFIPYIVYAIKTCLVIGCQPAQSPVMKLSVDEGKIVEYNSGKTLSDGSAGGIESGSITFDVCRVGIDKWITVEEDEIENAIFIAHKYHNNKIIEGAAGVALGAFIKMVEFYKMWIRYSEYFFYKSWSKTQTLEL